MAIGLSPLAAIEVDGQPLAANVKRLVEAYEYLGTPFESALREKLLDAAKRHDATELQRLLDPQVVFVIEAGQEETLTLTRGKGSLRLQQAGYTPLLVRVVNQTQVEEALTASSPQGGAVYAGVHPLSMIRQQQKPLTANENLKGRNDRFLDLELFRSPPMQDRLSGLAVEYAILLAFSSDAGTRSAELRFEAGEKHKSNTLKVKVDCKPAIPVTLRIRDHDGHPTMGKLLFRDTTGRVYPAQAKRIAPDFFFQPHVYRADGETVLLPPGRFKMQFSRGPEYRVLEREIDIVGKRLQTLSIDLQHWINPAKSGFYSGDHHIHAAGCAHYTSPSEGVTPADMFRQVKGEGLNVGCVLTWGPCYDFQRQFFAPAAAEFSEPLTLLKYDLEISGFGSQRLGHVCLLNLKDQTYPGSEGTSQKGWPTWTTPVMRWAKEQGGVTGYAHSASGLMINPEAASKRLLSDADSNKDGQLTKQESELTLLPEEFVKMDTDADGRIDLQELTASHHRATETLPNYAIPEMNGVGAMEICVSVGEGVCDFISAMDTARVQEWNCWYHLLNCGFPVKVSGETDFPCMSSRRVGQGRVYVQLPAAESLAFDDWCEGLAAGRSYVSDGFAHALDFQVTGRKPGTGDVMLEQAGTVNVTAQVAFAAEQPRAVAYGGVVPDGGKQLVGDTILLHGPRSEQLQVGGTRTVELVVNGIVATTQDVPADGQIHKLRFDVEIEQSSWVALRQFPQLHTNPVNVLVAGKPIRASRSSALWCIETIKLLWKNRSARIADAERAEAEATFQRAIASYRQIAAKAMAR
ncbi:MAG: hypothetical protein CMJ64_19605 [Planctomycetaceae bacterium]|nr:hypothetical protein [Planctomycetaceae bacterium]